MLSIILATNILNDLKLRTWSSGNYQHFSPPPTLGRNVFVVSNIFWWLGAGSEGRHRYHNDPELYHIKYDWNQTIFCWILFLIWTIHWPGPAQPTAARCSGDIGARFWPYEAFNYPTNRSYPGQSTEWGVMGGIKTLTIELWIFTTKNCLLLHRSLFIFI